jgi:hypothetical protein
MLAAGRQVAHERANAVTAVGQHRDRLIRWLCIGVEESRFFQVLCG